MTTKTKLNDTTSITAAQIADLNNRYSAASDSGLQSERDKLLVIVSGFRLIKHLGGPNGTGVQPFYDQHGIKKAGDKPYNLAAQLVTAHNVTTAIKGDAKKRARNIADRAADLMAACGHFTATGVLTDMTDEQVADWIELNGGLNGVVKKHKEGLKAPEADDDAEDVIDLQAHRTALELAGIKLPISQPLIATEPCVSLHQRDGGNLIVLPLNGIPADLMERLRDFLPTPDANASPSIKLWGGVALACQLFDRDDSRLPLRVDQERHEGEAKAPSRPIVRLLSGSTLSIASSRVDAGVVVMVDVLSEELRLKNIDLPAHLNGTATNLLSDKLSSAAGRGAFDKAMTSIDDDGRVWIKFKGKENVKDFRTRVLPMSLFGSTVPQWTLGVSPSFKPGATARLDCPDGKLPADLVKMADKAGTSRHPVVLAIRGGKLSLALGQSAEQEVGGEGSGSADLLVSSRDFARAVEFGRQLGATTFIASLDAKGMAALTFTTDQADYTAHLPALNGEGAHLTALLDVIEKPTA